MKNKINKIVLSVVLTLIFFFSFRSYAKEMSYDQVSSVYGYVIYKIGSLMYGYYYSRFHVFIVLIVLIVCAIIAVIIVMLVSLVRSICDDKGYSSYPKGLLTFLAIVNFPIALIAAAALPDLRVQENTYDTYELLKKVNDNIKNLKSDNNLEEEPTTQVSTPTQPVSDEPWYCSNCGFHNPAGTGSCQKCGTNYIK